MHIRPVRKYQRHCVLFVLLCSLASAVPAEENRNIGLGPIAVPSLSPGQLFRPNPSTMHASHAPQGSFVFFTTLTWGNVWNLSEGSYRIDGEWTRLSSKISYVVFDNLELGTCIPVTLRSGGFGDSAIEHFHKTFRLDNASREKYPQNEMVIEVNTPEDGTRKIEGGKYGIGDIVLFGSWTATRGGEHLPCITITMGLSLPTGNEQELFGIGNPVFGADILLTKRFGSSPWIAILGGSASYCRRDRMLGLDINNERFTILAGVEYQWSPRLSFIVQELRSSPFAVDFHELSDPSYELNAGLKYRVTPQGNFEFSLQENLFKFNNSTDFGLHAGYEQIF